MKRILLIVAVLAVSCDSGTKRPAAPSDLIPHDTMVLLMHDMMLMETYVESSMQRMDKYYKTAKKSGRKILSDYHISPERFDTSYNWYVANGEELEKIYQEVLERMNQEAAELSARGVKPATDMPLQNQPVLGNPLGGR